MLIDTHAHLDMKPFAGDLDAVLSRAEEAGVVHIVTVSIDHLALRRNLAIAEERQNVSVTAGIHCHEAASFTEEAWEEIARGAAHPSVVAVGETGLDFFRDYAPHDHQEALFREHIEMAREAGLPLILHSRGAEARVLDKARLRDSDHAERSRGSETAPKIRGGDRDPRCTGEKREQRDESAVTESLAALRGGSEGESNLMALIVDAARVRATEGEIADAMKDVFGGYREPPRV